jgi:hypothetical protein
MRYGMRVGRRSWVTGGGGVLVASLLSDILRATLFGAIYVVRAACLLAVELGAVGLAAHHAYRTRRNAVAIRKAQLVAPLRGSVSVAAAASVPSATKLWAVYVVGNDFHHGVFPKRKAELMQLYPERAGEIAQVAFFPDPARARSAATQLQRMGFSYREFSALFPEIDTPPRQSAAVEQRKPSTSLPDANAPTQTIETKEPIMSTGRDFTQYTFDGQKFGKGRLVLALVKRYVQDNPDAAFNDVRAAFPDHLQADSPTQFSEERRVVARFKDLPHAAQRRYFVGDGETIALRDCVAVVSREWNLGNIQNVLKAAQQLGYKVEVEPKDR